ncbi:MAG: putative metal-binding motif-containing protein [Patescibacteria group bacterium]
MMKVVVVVVVAVAMIAGCSTRALCDYDCDNYCPEEFLDPGETPDWSDNDCNDYDPAVYPGADEYCDGVDNDCDEEIDEGDCTAGTPPPYTLGCAKRLAPPPPLKKHPPC